MGKYSDIDSLVDEMRTNLRRLADRTLDALNEETSKAMEDANHEFGAYQQMFIEQIFRNAVDAFYDAYSPKSYQRTGGLYDVLDLKLDDSGMVVMGANGDYRSLFNETNFHSDRSGGNLFEKVFIDGYHGGAESISGGKADVWGAHPSPGIPYYRAPGLVRYSGETRKRWHRYGRWGSRAIRTESPYKIIARNLSAAEATEMFSKFKEISQKHNDAAVEKVRQNIPKFHAEIYG